MYFVALGRDRADAGSIRLEQRPAHLDFLKGLGGAVKAAGPLLSDDGESMVGSLLVVEADSLDAAKAMLAGDPYGEAGLFESFEVKPWRWVVNPPAE